MERNITMVALFAALVAVLGLVPAVNLTAGVPITAQSLGVMLCGTVLGARRGALAVLLFLLLVAAGLPLLAGGRGGLGVFTSPSVGFLIGFPLAAYVSGTVMEARLGSVLFSSIVGSLLGGIVVLYAFGVNGMAFVLDKSFGEALALSAPFLPGDLIKVFLAGLITQGIHRTRPEALLSRL